MTRDLKKFLKKLLPDFVSRILAVLYESGDHTE